MVDEVLASAAAKLAHTEHPIAVLRHKYQLHGLSLEAARLQHELEEGELILAGPAPLQPQAFWAPLNWLRRRFYRRRQVRQAGNETALRARMDKVKKDKADLARFMDQKMVGILTPLNVGDERSEERRVGKECRL